MGYAEGTTVPVEKTRAEIEIMLKKAMSDLTHHG